MISSNLRLFEQKLIEKDLITQKQLYEIKKSNEFFIYGLFESLLNQKSIALEQLYQTAAQVWSVPFIKLTHNNYVPIHDIDIPDKVLDDMEALMLKDENSNHLIALGKPEKLSQINQLGFYTEQKLEPVLADIHSIRKARNQRRHLTINNSNNPVGSNDLTAYLEKSLTHNASDVHVEMFHGHCSLRIRVDGVLHPLASISCDQGLRLISQTKLIAHMDIAQSRLPQDGRFTHQIKNQPVSLRVNSIPTIHGEKLVLRILQQHAKQFKLNQIGLSAEQYQLIREIIKQPSGLILVCGPTGSGKTVTLYALLELLSTGKENISTIEDPAEIQVEGINQISINRKSGLDFSTALRALLRQDPDIIMIGEIRDNETAQISVRAAQTGHLVLATLHSRTAANAEIRLLQLGVNQYSLDQALRLTIAQRLIRKLCPQCQTKHDVSKSAIELFNNSNLAVPKHIYQALGCPLCLQGYKHRTGIFELLTDKHHFGQVAAADTSLIQAGLNQVADGKTSLDELLRVL